ncbi:uncharacterized protein [Spinacia oleracea]|uniref:Reverse transcriptase domain-containing protein n=1 Tax=Spinacia oleracea TaxID=3562 RepID=A0ABM3R8J4_SPIOL|nr:uncharacterized protein LOC130467454 [Spinacia oleracea]
MENPVTKQQEQHNSTTVVHTPEVLVPNVTDPTPWKIVTRRTKGLSRMRALSPSNPKELTGGDMEMHNQTNPPDEEALLETRVKESNFNRVVNKFGRSWKWENNYTKNPRGRIWVGWQYLEVDIHVLQVHEQYIHCEIRDRHGVVDLYVTLVYGLHSIDTRKILWNSLTTLASSVGRCPWIITGDFNSPLYADDRINGAPVSAAEMKDFNEFITGVGLCPLKSVGHYFSWHKGTGEGKIASRIDWCLGNADWIHKFSNVQVEYLNPSISDHSPLLINCFPDKAEGGRPFRFFNYLDEHSNFSAIIQTAFSDEVHGTPMFKLWCKLKKVKAELKKLHKEDFSGLTEKIALARSELDNVQQNLQTTSIPELLNQEVVCIKQLRHWLRIDEIALRQKSRIQWIQLGDSNNQFFFSTVKERARFNRISILYDDNGTKLVEPDLIQAEILSFYKKLLGTSANTLPSIHLPTMRNGPTLNNDARQELCRNVTDDEIDLAMHGIGNDKAPGPDGLNAVFFKKAWPFIKQDIYRAVKDVFATNSMLPQYNYTSITLIPKIPNPTKVKEYRPIACCNVVYKIVSKILTARMQGVIGQVVSECQSGFIPERQISDNILLATELIKGYTRDHLSPRCMLKIDLKKAYDSIEWPFLVSVMDALGFPHRFVQWVFTCISTVSYSVLINGKPCTPFQEKKGLRQGDPMSPFLFAIGMEYLSKHLHELQSQPDFNFHPRCGKLALTHLMFADDLLLFCRDKAEILNVVSIHEGTFPFRYLGVPLSTKKLKYNQCRPLIEKVLARAKVWTVKHLSYAGNTDPSKKALVAWHILCLPKVAGGLNLKDMCWWNKAAVAKLLWAITYKKDRLWCKWAHAYYIKGRDIGSTHWPVNMSWPLRKILNSQNLVDNIRGWSAFHRPVSQLDNEVMLMSRAAKRTGDRFKLLLMFFAECLYGIWLQRNAKISTQSCRSPHDLLRDIKYRVACRATDQQKSIILISSCSVGFWGLVLIVFPFPPGLLSPYPFGASLSGLPFLSQFLFPCSLCPRLSMDTHLPSFRRIWNLISPFAIFSDIVVFTIFFFLASRTPSVLLNLLTINSSLSPWYNSPNLGFFLGYGYEAPPITGLRLAASAPSTTNAASHRLSAVRVCMR